MHAYVDIDANMMSNLIYDHAILEFHAMGDMLAQLCGMNKLCVG